MERHHAVAAGEVGLNESGCQRAGRVGGAMPSVAVAGGHILNTIIAIVDC